MSRPIPDLFVEQHRLGELDPAHRADVEALPDLDARVAALDASDREILDTLPPNLVMPAVRLRARQRRSAWMVSALALAATLMLAVAVVPQLVQGPPPPGERTKGLGDTLQLHRLEGTDAVPLRPGDLAQSGDRVQLSYVAQGEFGVIVSIDGRGAVTLHSPHGSNRAAELLRGGAQPLPQSYELDDAPAFERFIFVTGPSAFDVEMVRKAAEALASDPRRAASGPLDLPAELSQESFLLRKAQP